jgi:hypothetical protein
MKDRHSVLSIEEIGRFEAAAGDLLDELGYARPVPRPSPRILGDVSEVRERFVRDVRSRVGLLPERWGA